MVRAAIAVVVAFLSASGVEVPVRGLTEPVDHSLYQRGADGRGRIPIAGPSGTGTPGISCRLVDHQTQAAVVDWQALPVQVGGGVWRGVLSAPAGWYRLEVRLSATVDPVVVDHVGIGEVFITAGQSNSANHGKPPQIAEDERIVACDAQTGAWRHGDDPQPMASGHGGSPWPSLGGLLVRRLGVPVGFVCVGVGSTAVAQWAPGGRCHPRLAMALKRVGPNGARAVLWHQGESDALAGTTTEEYARLLGLTITQSRRDAGWDVPWGVAIAAAVPNAKATAANQAAVIAGQRQVIASIPGVFAGPDTNDFHTRRLCADGVHFNAAGLAAHAAGWDATLRTAFPDAPMVPSLR